MMIGMYKAILNNTVHLVQFSSLLEATAKLLDAMAAYRDSNLEDR